ncbi:hypothetical protein U0L90_03315 [Flavobacteriaceae sp. LMIT009]
MKAIKKTVFITLLSFIITGFSQCSSAQKLQDKAPVEITEVYYQRWAAGVRGGGAGVNLFIIAKDAEIELDSVYFRGRVCVLETKPQDPNVYIGRFITVRESFDIVMSGDSIAEYGNKLPPKDTPIPFQLDVHECVISYKDGKKTKYFKIEGIKEREVEHYPMGRKQ